MHLFFRTSKGLSGTNSSHSTCHPHLWSHHFAGNNFPALLCFYADESLALMRPRNEWPFVCPHHKPSQPFFCPSTNFSLVYCKSFGFWVSYSYKNALDHWPWASKSGLVHLHPLNIRNFHESTKWRFPQSQPLPHRHLWFQGYWCRSWIGPHFGHLWGKT